MKISSSILKRTFLACFCLLLLTSCKTKIAYSFLDFIIHWQIDNYVTLDAKQKEKAKGIVDDFHQWHRATQLPRYANYVEGLKVRLTKEAVTGQSIHWETDQIQDLLDTSAHRLIPEAAAIMTTFSDQQVAEVIAEMAKEREKYAKKHVNVSLDKVYKERIKELEKNTQRLFGSFTKEQKQWVNEWVTQLKPYEELTLKQQETWAQNLKAAFDDRANQEKMENTLLELLFYRTDYWDQELQDRLDYNQVLTYDLMAKILNNLTPKQKHKMDKELDQYVSDFNELARAAKTEKVRLSRSH
ncbi:DUF6279 family lipoprotein [Teredinibacter sp. KSP-S5-2]|uniref:DUF6279 family lipoprotein n=1 Tax=Teredinibacter sp. KSP-S5-2 TaxID=3034506 RepID=UPI0029347EFD|nr:DUF6279 family lipoprotein [Teredinibacter sp. KSP-S5-2]WNO09542.1 DUF6279 family lipoprotein [Teredinibacter sp. KSP-S5-2]